MEYEMIVVEGEKYPRRYIYIYNVMGRKIKMDVEVPHPPSEEGLKNWVKCARKIMIENHWYEDRPRT